MISEFTVADNLNECSSIELQLITENPRKKDPYSKKPSMRHHHLKISKKDFRNAFEEYLGFRQPTQYVGGNPDGLPFDCFLEKDGKMIIVFDCRQQQNDNAD